MFKRAAHLVDASELLHEILPYIGEEGLPCYVEADGEKDVSTYRHFGFKVVNRLVMPGPKDKMVVVLREPNTTEKHKK